MKRLPWRLRKAHSVENNLWNFDPEPDSLKSHPKVEDKQIAILCDGSLKSREKENSIDNLYG